MLNRLHRGLEKHADIGHHPRQPPVAVIENQGPGKLPGHDAPRPLTGDTVSHHPRAPRFAGDIHTGAPHAPPGLGRMAGGTHMPKTTQADASLARRCRLRIMRRSCAWTWTRVCTMPTTACHRS